MLVSDLHTEEWTYEDLKDFIYRVKLFVNDDYLIIAGDLGHLNKSYIIYLTLLELTKIFKYVIWVPGNHEYFGFDVNMADRLMKTIVCKVNEKSYYGATYFLNMDEIKINDIRFIGCTLWSENPIVHPEPRDYDITSEDRLKLHLKHKSWLRWKLERNPGVYIVITHHCPVNYYRKCLPEPDYYLNELQDLVELSKSWCFGHIHFARTITYKDKKIYTNPIGKREEGRIYKPCYLD